MSAVVSKNILASIFKRKGGEGEYTKLFENFSTNKQQKLLQKVLLESGEEAILAHIGDDENWCLLTTSRFIWSKLGKMQEIGNDQLENAEMDLSLEIKLKISNPKKIRGLKLTTKSGEHFTVEIEPGFPFGGMWNVLKFLAIRKWD
jgi:hypothetical protein